MKVLLKDDVLNLGYAGEVIDVADGFGRNYLIPRGLAVKATSGALRETESWRERAAARVQEIRHENKALAQRINEVSLIFYARAGETGKLYGSVTTSDIAEKLNQELGTDIDRHLISSGPLRQLGEHKVTIKLGRDFHPQVTVNIHPLESETEGPDGETMVDEAETAADIAASEGEEAADMEGEFPEMSAGEEEAYDDQEELEETEFPEEDSE